MNKMYKKFDFIIIFVIFVLSNTVCVRAIELKNGTYRVHRVDIRGNEILSDRAITRVMLTHGRNIFRAPLFHDALFEDDLKTISTLYRNNGFWEADVSSNITIVDSSKQLINIAVEIFEGPRITVDSVVFQGNQKISTADLQKLISQKQGRPFSKGLLERDNYKILARYAQGGYIDAVVRPDLKLDSERHRLAIVFVIDEGKKIRIRQIVTRGLEKTKPVVINRELLFKSDSFFNYEKILNSQRRLERTGLFESVVIKPIIFDSTRIATRDVEVKVTEKQTGEFNFGFGFGSYDRLRGSTEFFQNNFQGMGMQIGTRLSVSFKLQRFEFSFTNPWLFFRRMKFDANTFAEHRIEPNYELKAIGGRATVGTDISRRWKIDVGYKIENDNYSNIKGNFEAKEVNRGKISRLRLRLNRESRDSQVNPTSGSFFEQRVEFAGGFLKGAHTFLKISSEYRYFKKVLPTIVSGLRVHLGWMDRLGKSLIIPLNERFYAGGDGSIRGYNRRTVGPLRDGDIPTGGKVTMIANCELRFPIYKKLGGTVFWDSGNVWSKAEDFSLQELRHSVGGGLRYNSPLGIVRIDGGLKVDRRKDEGGGEIYFTLGHIF